MDKITEHFKQWNTSAEQPKSGGIILAGSGSGKSTFISNRKDPRFVDGDDVVGDLYPDKPEWWKDPDLGPKTQELTTTRIVEYAVANPESVIFWIGAPDLLEKKTSEVSIPIVAVVPSDEDLKRNEEARAAEDSSAPKDVLQQGQSLFESAKRSGWPIYKNFDDAIRFLDSVRKPQVKQQDQSPEDTSGESKADTKEEVGDGDT
jgi:hypothetical protein